MAPAPRILSASSRVSGASSVRAARMRWSEQVPAPRNPNAHRALRIRIASDEVVSLLRGVAASMATSPVIVSACLGRDGPASVG